MKQVRRGVRLSEVLRVGRAEGVVGVGVAGFAVKAVKQNLLGGGVDHGPVAAGIIRASRNRSQEALVPGGEALEPGVVPATMLRTVSSTRLGRSRDR